MWILRATFKKTIRKRFSFIQCAVCMRKKAENAEIKSIRCHDDIGPLTKIEINVTADIVALGLGTKKYEAARKNKWFKVIVQAILKNGLHNMSVLSAEEYFSGKFDKEDALDEYLIPYIYVEDLEDISDDFTAVYCHNVAYDGWKMPIGHILKETGIKYYEADLPEDEFGRMYFRPTTETVEERCFYPHLYDTAKSVEKELQPWTMLISKKTPLWVMWAVRLIPLLMKSSIGNTSSTLTNLRRRMRNPSAMVRQIRILPCVSTESSTSGLIATFRGIGGLWRISNLPWLYIWAS